ncbi:hypothetical protein CEXT_368961 [Caerostris extrusa]|uniref:Serine/threonine-protein phosphatase 4 regulatory subunit 1 n=1 Tax=Caerostris extrusa TaxID=172846 RepID=A0AAV4ML33_CAEEX|nr:hypothetical protein CEXT_368961 [Caerostris extrusa]
MGKKATEDLFFEPLFNLMTDPSNNIRKACASTFGDICTAVGRETTENTLLPKFLELCKDGAWCVRKACTENFMALSCCVSKETRCNELSSVYMNLLKDTSRWVRLTAYQSLGGFISTFADPDRTGLYYSKDGTLTIVDTSSSQVLTPLQEPSTNPSNEALSNEEIKESNSLSSDDSSSLDRTNSLDSCDSIVPVCNAGTDSSASEVSCHAGNNCSVIEASTSTMTSSGEDGIHAAETMLTNDSSNGSFHCDSEQLTSNVNSCDNWISNSKPVQNGECHKKDVDDDEREFEKLWSEAVLTCDEVINGALNHNEMNGDVDIHASLDNELVQRIDSADASALLNSIAEFQHSNCETIPIISCNNSIKENGNNAMNFEDDSVCLSYLQHSRYTGDSDFSSDVIPNLVFTAQESNVPKDVSLDNDSQESVELKVNATTDNESAFNYFQYWREPLPEIDIDTATQCLNDSPEEEISSSNYLLLTDVFNNEHRRGWWSYLDDSGDSNRSFLSCSDLSTENSILREMRIIDDESSENKGEPPPGTKLYPRDQDIVPPELLMQYVCMPEGQNSATDAEIARHCAYSLPAVALTLGREFWPCLKDTFTVLMNDIPSFVMMWKVRRTLAFSMHQLAVILGPEITSKDLIPVFSRLISDLDEVRIGILQNLCEFLKVLLPEERKQFLPSLPKFLVSSSDTESNFKNWRFRLILAEQLVLIANLYEPQEVSDHLVPLSLTLIKDKICEVRLAAVRCMAATMKRLGQHPTPLYTKAVLSDLTDKFVHSHKWLQRQLYVYICQQIVIEEALTADQFAEDALPQLLYLCWDRVPNVRIAIARCLAIVMWPLDIYSNPGSPHRELLLQTIHTLQSDIDADVRFYANMVSTHECSCLQNGDFNNVEEPDV